MTLRDHPQDITVWEPAANDGFGGFTFPAPTLIKGRWEQKQELFKDADGEEQMSEAIVYVDTDVSVGQYIAEGDQTAIVDPETLPNAHRIKQYVKIPDLRQNEYERKAIL